MSDSKKRRLSLSAKTLIGFAMGIACGVFFGDLCGWLQVIGDAFVGLLQMTVLPLIVLLLIASVGRLTPQQAARLVGRVGLILVILWVVGLLAVLLMASTFPPRQSAAFYSNSLLETPAPLDVVELFIPTNPFRSLANNWIPAVVIFSVGLGAAVMGMPDKERFLSRLDGWLDAIKRLNAYVVLLTPYGVFAIVAATAGTMTIEEMARIQAYLLSYTAAAVVLTFFLLPALVTSCTPFRYREILDVTLQAMITAFATAKLIVVLPMLIEKTQELFEKHGLGSDDIRADVEVIYPLMYPIPNLGKLLTLVFVPFAAWFVGTSLEATEYPSLLALGSVTYFGKPIIAMPFLLDAFRLPADMFQLFIVADVYCSRIGDVLAVMHLFTLTALGTCATRGLLHIRFPRMAARLGVSAGVAAILFFGLRGWLARSDSAGPSKEAAVAQMQLLRHPVPTVVHEATPQEPTPRATGVSHLDAIRSSGVIRVGFLPYRLPYSYFNSQGELVGFDVDTVNMLAEELQCRIEFFPFEYADLAWHLQANHFDLAISGLPITTSSLFRMRFSEPYLDVSLSFVVRDYRRKQFTTVDGIRRLDDLTIAVPADAYFSGVVKASFPNARLEAVRSVRDFFDGGEEEFDALLIDAESGSAWTFLHPGYRPVVPRDWRIKVPLGFAVARHDRDLSDFLSQWIELKRQSGDLEQLYNYWILGQIDTGDSRRWSILRNVLGIGAD